jgi:hypothetical protein
VAVAVTMPDPNVVVPPRSSNRGRSACIELLRSRDGNAGMVDPTSFTVASVVDGAGACSTVSFCAPEAAPPPREDFAVVGEQEKKN